MGSQTQSNKLQAASRVIRLVAALVAVVLITAAAAYGWWHASPTEQELRERAGLDGKTELRIGVMGDMPGISLRDEGTGHFTGFDVDIAHMVAADLGFRPDDVRFVVVRNEDRETMRAYDGTAFVSVDLVIASFSINDEREALPEVTFSAPYLRTELSLITRTGHPPIQSLDDLRDHPVCTLTTSTAEGPLARAKVRAIGKNRISECVPGLLSGEYEAMATDAAILAGFVNQHKGQLAFHDIGQSGQEYWGINAGTNEALRDLVNLSLCRSRNDPDDHRWEDAFDRHLRLPVQGQDIAVDEQPGVPVVNVRAWPGKWPSDCY